MFRRCRSLSAALHGHARRARVLLAVGVAGIAVIAAGCSAGKDSVGADGGSQFRFVEANRDGELIAADKRKTVPEFSGDSLSGGTLRLSDFRGKVVLVNFWGSWCSPCRAEGPDLQKLYLQEKGAGLEILGVVVKDQKQLAQAFVRKQKLTYPNIFDPQSRIALGLRNYPPNAIPSTILIDRSGRVAGIYLGGKTKSEFETVLKPLLAEHAAVQK